MRFTAVKGVVPRKRHNSIKRLEGELREFMKMNVKIVKVTYTEYKDQNSCRAALRKAINRYALPISVFTRDGVVYLINNEIE